MLEKLFGSKVRVKLLRSFLNSPSANLEIKEVAKKLRLKQSKLTPFVRDLILLGLLREAATANKSAKASEARFSLDPSSFLYPELKALFLKSDLLFERDLVARLERLGSVFYLALTGRLVGIPSIPVDLFLVARVNRRRLHRLMKSFERELGREINYAVMTKQEFAYRRSLTDRFLYSILEGRKIVAVNRLKI